MQSLARYLSGLVLLLLLLPSVPARAGGYDTPIVYSARHIGMGGTAIGGVDDASATFHNPAGLRGVSGLGLLADFSLLTGTLSATGGFNNDDSVDRIGDTYDSEPIVAPLFMLAGAYQIVDGLRAGLAVYPVASGAAEYRTEYLNTPSVDRTRVVFFELSPALSYDLPGNVTLGLGYRLTYATLERVQGFSAMPQAFDFELSGVDATGLRAGVQWHPTEALGIGLVYRHRIDVDLSADRALAVYPTRDAATTLTLPGKLGCGVRYDVGDIGLAADVEYGLNSQNRSSTIEGTRSDGVTDEAGNPKREAVDNIFRWSNSVTARVGAEYRVTQLLPLRAGYIFDGRVSSPGYPSAFGTPPAASHSVTVGGGYGGDWGEVNVALAHRFVSTTVGPDGIGDDPACATCAPAGDFSLRLWGMYVDYSIDIDVD